MPHNETKMRQYIIKRCNTEQFWFGSERTFGCVPLLREHLSFKTTSVAEGVVSDDRFYCMGMGTIDIHKEETIFFFFQT